MRRYLFAELRRTAFRRPHALLWGLLYAASAAAIGAAAMDEASGAKVTATACFVLFGYGPLAVGVIELIYCCGEDLRSKIAQAAIGQGVGRGRLVLAKWLQTGVTLLFGLGGLTAVIAGSALAFGMELSASVLGSIACAAACAWVKTQLYLALALLALYPTQNLLTALLFYLLLSSGAAGLMAEVLMELAALTGLIRWTPSHLLDRFASQLELGYCNPSALGGIVLCAALSLGAAAALFRKKELEF